LPDLWKRFLLLLTILASALFLIRIAFAFVEPSYSFVDDDTYVSAAIHLLLGHQCAPVVDNVCNYEHPPLSKLLTALGFEIFGRTQVIGAEVGLGVNQLGGRFFNILMATLLVPLTYLIVKKMSGNLKMAFLAGLFVLVDPLAFTLSLTAGLDIAMVFFGMLALIPYVYGLRLGKLNSFLITGFVFGLSLLSKETAVFIIGAFVSYVLILGEGPWKSRLLGSAEVLFGAAVVFIVGLQLFDSIFTTFPSFISHLEAMVQYHLNASPVQINFLTEHSNCTLYPGLCPNNKSLVPHFLYSGLPLGIVQNTCTACWAGTNPLDWFTYFPPVSFPTALVLAPNYPLVWMSFVWVPLGAVRVARRKFDSDLKPVALAGSILVWNLASDIWLYLDVNRVVFEWYLLPVVPAFAIGGAYLLTRPSTPRWVLYLGAAAVVIVGILLSPVVYHILYPQPQYCNDC